MIRLVRIPTAVGDAALAGCLADLPDDEPRPAARRRVVAHAVLRRLLGERLGLAAQHVRLHRLCGGKPVLAQALAGKTPAPLHFSLSYTGDEALLALASAPVGVDIESVVPQDVAQVARHVYADEERARLRGVHAPRIPRIFLDIWTAKEAVLKFLGTGFNVEPRALCVPPAAPGFQPVCVAAVAAPVPCVVASWRLAHAVTVAVSTACAPQTMTWEHYRHESRY